MNIQIAEYVALDTITTVSHNFKCNLYIQNNSLKAPCQVSTINIFTTMNSHWQKNVPCMHIQCKELNHISIKWNYNDSQAIFMKLYKS